MLATIRSSILSSSLLSRNIKVKTYKIITMSAVLCGCETWSLALKKEHGLRVFESRALRRIFGPGKDELTEQRKLHNEELCNCTHPQI
jgi:hypothetical protein